MQEGESTEKKPKKSHRGRWVAGGVILLILAVAGGSKPKTSEVKVITPAKSEVQSSQSANSETATPAPTPVAAPEPQPEPQVQPQATSAPKAATTTSVSVVSVSSPVSRGAYATLTAKTAPGETCGIVVHYKSGASTAAGLESKSADGSGNISWTWKVGTNTTPGSWSITVTCGSATINSSFSVN